MLMKYQLFLGKKKCKRKLNPNDFGPRAYKSRPMPMKAKECGCLYC